MAEAFGPTKFNPGRSKPGVRKFDPASLAERRGVGVPSLHWILAGLPRFVIQYL
jgi:hypothetical protein